MVKSDNKKNGKILAIIPARGGSKRLPGKNLLPLADKPLLSWTIEAAQKSEALDEICVTTDDPQIADTARSCGAAVPFIRPAFLSSDDASSVDVVLHALEFYRGTGKEFSFFMLLQPTSPLRSAQDIKNAIILQRERNAEVVISVCEVDHSPLWTGELPGDNSLDGFIKPEIMKLRSQSLPAFYRLNGAIYLCACDTFIKEKTFLPEKGGFAYIMPRERSIDIDTLLDFKIAETIIKHYGSD